MNTNSLLGLLALIVVVGGGIWFFSSKNPQGSASPSTDSPVAGTGTIADLAVQTGSWECDVTSDTDGVSSVGKAFVSDRKVRADFVSNVAALGNKEVGSHMIQTQEFVYAWSDMAPQGTRMMIPANSDVLITSDTGTVGTNAPVTYSCVPWTANEALFTPPSGVTFFDVPFTPPAQ